GLALRHGQHGHGVHGSPCAAFIIGMRPSPPTQAPAKHRQKGTREERQIYCCGTWRCIPYSIFPHDSADWPAEQIIPGLRTLIKCLSNNSDERDSRPHRVAQRRVAAVRIPSIKTFGSKPQSGDAALSLRTRERRGRDLDDVGARMTIKQVGTAEVMRKYL